MTGSPRAVLVLATAARLALPAAAQGQAPAAWPDFTRALDGFVAADSIVGAAAIVVRDGRIVAHHERGWADRAAGQPVDTSTIFHWGSITKTMTAIAVMQLRDRGLLSLDDRVTTYVPELRRVHDAYGSMDSVTIRMLLSHSAGFQNPTWPYSDGKPWQPFEPTTWEQLVAMMPYQELLFKPGARFSYSNPGFIYLARIIESLTGDPWESYVQKNILAPLGMTRSYFRTTPYYLAEHRSNNYYVVRDSGGPLRVQANGREFDPGITVPNGGLNAPLTDMARYVAFLTNAPPGAVPAPVPYDVVLKRATLAEMWRPRYVMDSSAATPQSMGLGFFVVPRSGTTLIAHSGSQAGFVSYLAFNPANRTAAIFAINTLNTVVPHSGADFSAVSERALTLLR